jgi:tetratricopeptide (TPR) repeat protein
MQNAAALVAAVTLAAFGAGCGKGPARPVPAAEPIAITNPPPVPVAAPATNVIPSDPAAFLAWVTNQTDTVALLNAGTELVGRGALREGVICLRRAVELKPDDEEAHFSLAFAYARGNAVDAAIAEYKKALEIFPEYAEAHNNLGNLYLRQKRHEDAIASFGEALKANAEFGSAHNNLGRALAELGRGREALPHFQSAIRLDPQNIEAQFNLGTAFSALGRTNDAIAQFNEVLRRRPGFPPALQSIERLRGGK